jgi:hypothetical protein
MSERRLVVQGFPLTLSLSKGERKAFFNRLLRPASCRAYTAGDCHGFAPRSSRLVPNIRMTSRTFTETRWRNRHRKTISAAGGSRGSHPRQDQQSDGDRQKNRGQSPPSESARQVSEAGSVIRGLNAYAANVAVNVKVLNHWRARDITRRTYAKDDLTAPSDRDPYLVPDTKRIALGVQGHHKSTPLRPVVSAVIPSGSEAPHSITQPA